MYDVKLKNKRLLLTPRSYPDNYSELMYDPYDDRYRVHIILPYDSDLYINTGYDLNSVFFYDDRIELYDSVDYHKVDIHVDPNKYYIEVDMDEVLDILLVVIKEKEN